jgi:hypothetical protein
LPLHEIDGARRRIVVDRFHPLLRQRPGILHDLFANLAETRVDCRVVRKGGLAIEYAPRAVPLMEGGILGIVAKLGLFLGVQVAEISVKLVEAVDRR